MRWNRSTSPLAVVAPAFLLLVCLSPDSVSAQGFTGCDSGDPATICTVSSVYSFTSGEVIEGSGRLVVATGGRIENLEPLSEVGITFSEVVLEPGAVIAGGRITVTAASLEIASGGWILADGLGFPRGTGPGAALGTYGYEGAGHGGVGGAPDGAVAPLARAGGVSYGSSLAPVTFGSGGVTQSDTGSRAAGDGGGAVRLAVTGTLMLEGTVSASGTGAYEDYHNPSGGGSGGSIWVTAGTLSGSGSLHADGGSASSVRPSGGGGGAGGRIAVYYGSSALDPSTSTVSGAPSSSGERLGHDGTLLFIEQGGDRVYVKGGFLTVDETVTVGFHDPAAPELWDFTAYDVTLDGLWDTLLASTTLRFGPQMTATALRWDCRGEQIGLEITAPDLELDAASAIDLTGCGHPRGTGPGAGEGALSYDNTGAGHGGVGGATDVQPQPWARHGGAAYGSSLAPVTFGSGGGNAALSGPRVAGDGGGAVRLEVTGTLVLEGTITANGTPAGWDAYNRSGGGSGGSIWVTAGFLSGGGSLHADGGSAETGRLTGGGGGAGGRIAVYYGSLALDPSTSTVAGAPSASGERFGHDGTLLFIEQGGDRIYVKGGFLTVDETVTVGFHDPAAPELWDFRAYDVTLDGVWDTLLASTTLRFGPRLAASALRWDCRGSEIGLTVSAPDLSLDAASSVDLTGCGYGTGHGPGAGLVGYYAGGGAGHGAAGSPGSPGQQNGGPSYGDERQPILPGSGGGVVGASEIPGGDGGGVVRLAVAASLLLDGTIRADATGPPSTRPGGGGSGGSIWVTAGSLSGAGSLHADGGGSWGSGETFGGCGAGGRVALRYRQSEFQPTAITAAPGITLCNSEHDESGSLVTEPFGDEELPDLAVLALEIDFSPANPLPGEEVAIRAVAHNLGGADTGAFTVDFYHFDAAIAAIAIPSLVAGESITRSITTVFASEGLHLVGVRLDPDNSVLELDEDNNEATKVLLVGQPTYENARILVQASPATQYPSCPALVSGRADYDFDSVAGTEDFPVQGGRVTVTVRDPGSGEDLSVFTGEYTHADGLLRQPIRTPVTPGSYDLVVAVTDETLSAEVETTLTVLDGEACDANGGGNGEPVGGTPDVYVRSEGIHLGWNSLPDHPAVGEEIAIVADIHYTAADALEVEVRINDVFPVLGELRTLSIGSGFVDFDAESADSPQFFAQLWSTLTDGAHVIQIEVEPVGGLEQPTHNDQATRLIFIGEAPDVTLAKDCDLTIDADGNSVPTPGDVLTCTLDFANPGAEPRTGALLVDDYDEKLVLEPFGITGGGWVTAGTIVWTLGDLAPGESGAVSYQAELGAIPVGTEMLINTAFLDTDQTPAVAARVEIELNRPPVAVAGQNQRFEPGDTIYLDGRASYDDNTPSELLLYAWSFVSWPEGCEPYLIGAETPTPSFVADCAGLYEVQLIVIDEGGLPSDESLVKASSDNVAPTAEVRPDCQPVLAGSTVELDGSSSWDPDDAVLDYTWTLTAKPEGSAAELIASDTTASFFADLPGDYEVTLVVSDEFGPGEPDEVLVTATTPDDLPGVQIVLTGCEVAQLPPEAVTTEGNRTAFLEHLEQAVRAIEEGRPDKAIDKLEKALSRTDGCAARGEPDGNGPGYDWIVTCPAQAPVYETLHLALAALEGP